MSEKTTTAGGGGDREAGGERPGRGDKRAEREARLAEQLRANLLRRKRQARGRRSGEPPLPSTENG